MSAVGATPVPVRTRHDSRGLAIAAAWLIGIGVVFLVQDVAGWDWAEAWPLFVILLGAESLIASLAGWRRRSVGAWSLAWSIGWIVVGGVLLLSTTGQLSTSVVDMLRTWGPAAVVAVGVWFLVAAVWPGGAPRVEHLNVPLVAPGNGARLRIRHGAGSLELTAGLPGILVEGDCHGGVVVRSAGANDLELSVDTSGGWPFGWDRGVDWRLGLAPDVPISLRIDAGANHAELDLSGLLVPVLEFHTGASDSTITLPARGVTRVAIDAGAASVALTVPTGTAARIRSRVALASVMVDPNRFRALVDGYETADFATNPNRAEIELRGAIGRLRVT